MERQLWKGSCGKAAVKKRLWKGGCGKAAVEGPARTLEPPPTKSHRGLISTSVSGALGAAAAATAAEAEAVWAGERAAKGGGTPRLPLAAEAFARADRGARMAVGAGTGPRPMAEEEAAAVLQAGRAGLRSVEKAAVAVAAAVSSPRGTVSSPPVSSSFTTDI